MTTNKWYEKIVEAQTEAFLYSCGEYAHSDSPDNEYIGHFLFPLIHRIQFRYICKEDCYWNHGFVKVEDSLSWIEFNEKLRVELCDVLLSHTRSLIKDALTEVEFPEEGILEQLKKKLPVLFSE